MNSVKIISFSDELKNLRARIECLLEGCEERKINALMEAVFKYRSHNALQEVPLEGVPVILRIPLYKNWAMVVRDKEGNFEWHYCDDGGDDQGLIEERITETSVWRYIP